VWPNFHFIGQFCWPLLENILVIGFYNPKPYFRHGRWHTRQKNEELDKSMEMEEITICIIDRDSDQGSKRRKASE